MPGYNEETVRKIVSALRGVVYHNHVDPAKVSVEEMVSTGLGGRCENYGITQIFEDDRQVRANIKTPGCLTDRLATYTFHKDEQGNIKLVGLQPHNYC